VLTSTDMNSISIKVPDHLLKMLEKEARARRTTKSSLVREYLEKALTAPPARGEATCYDLARDLAGSIKGLPRDLVTKISF
jgi:predicted transcriptional regulator